MRDLGKFIVAKGFNNLPKVQKIAQSGHTALFPHLNVHEDDDDDDVVNKWHTSKKLKMKILIKFAFGLSLHIKRPRSGATNNNFGQIKFPLKNAVTVSSRKIHTLSLSLVLTLSLTLS